MYCITVNISNMLKIRKLNMQTKSEKKQLANRKFYFNLNANVLHLMGFLCSLKYFNKAVSNYGQVVETKKKPTTSNVLP